MKDTFDLEENPKHLFIDAFLIDEALLRQDFEEQARIEVQETVGMFVSRLLSDHSARRSTTIMVVAVALTTVENTLR